MKHTSLEEKNEILLEALKGLMLWARTKCTHPLFKVQDVDAYQAAQKAVAQMEEK